MGGMIDKMLLYWKIMKEMFKEDDNKGIPSSTTQKTGLKARTIAHFMLFINNMHEKSFSFEK
jgi:hypothetical protein